MLHTGIETEEPGGLAPHRTKPDGRAVPLTRARGYE